ncbi:unnamed protein product [Closterium sp. NIES-53]
MHSRLLVSGLPRSLPPLPPSPAPPCLPCIEGRQRATRYSSFPPTTAPLRTLHMDVWGPARVSGQGRERYFLLVVDDSTRYTTVFPLRSKDGVVDVLIPWIRSVRLQLRERFRQDLPVLRLHSDKGGEFSSNLLRDFCCGEGILQSFMLPDSPQENGNAERRIDLVMEVGDATVFRVWGSRAFVRDTFADKLLAHAMPCVFLDFVPDAPGWQFYHPTSRRVLPSQDVTFDESVPFYHLFPYRFAPPSPPPFLAPDPLPVDPLPPQGLAPSGVSQVDPLPGSAPVQVAVGSSVSRSAASMGAASRGAELGGSESEGTGCGGAEPGGEGSGGAEPAGVEPWGAEPEGVEPGGAELEGTESGGAEPRGAASPGGPAGASPRLSPQQLCEWLVQRACLRSGATGAGGTGDAGAGGAGVTAGAGGPGGSAAAGLGGARTRAGGSCAGRACAGGAGAGGAGVEGTYAGGAGAGGAGGTVLLRPYFVPLLQQVLGVPSSTSFSPPFLCPLLDQSQPPLLLASSLPAPSPYSEQSGGLTERREHASRPVSSVCTAHCVPHSCFPPVPGTHAIALRPSSVPLRVPLPPPSESSLPEVPDSESDCARAASPTVSRLLATVVTDPSFESAAASALVAELLDFATTCLLDYATALVAESEQEDFECLAAAVPHFASMLLAPEGDPDAPDIPTQRSYAEAITGPYSSQWEAAMDAKMASWKSTGTCVDEVPPPGANIVDGMWIFRVKRPPGSPPPFKAHYVARGFSHLQGVDYFQTFSPTSKMTTLWVLLHVAAQRDYELHSLDISTAFLHGSLHEEIWLRRQSGFTGSFPAGPQWSLRWPVYGLCQAPCEWHGTLRTTLAALGFAPSIADPSLFLRTDTSLPPFYVLVYVDDLVFATADTEALTLGKSELQKRHTSTDLGELRSYLGLQITRDRARRTITLTQSHMVHHLLQRFGFHFSSPQPTPLSTSHSLSAPPSDESVEPSGPYPELVGCLMYLMMCTQPDLAYPLSLLARYVAPDASWVDDLATQRSSQGYTFSLGSGSVSKQSTRSSSVLSSSCEAEIYAGAMAAQELCWLTYLLTDLGEQPSSPPVLYVDNKAMIALSQEHRLEHRTKHIALRYFLAQELQQRGQLRLAYVATRANTADIFTKALPLVDHQRFSTVLGLLALLFLTELVLRTFTLDSGASRSFFRGCNTLSSLKRPVAVSLADPSGGPFLAYSSTDLPYPAVLSGSLSGLHLPSFSSNLRVTHCLCTRMGRHLATFTRQPGSSLYTLTTVSPLVAESGQVAASGQVFAAASQSGPESAPCSCRLLSHQTLLWHHRLGHPSLPRLRGMASRVLVIGLPRSLPPLPPGPAPTCVPCVEGRQRTAPHSSEFPPMEAPLQTFHMDVWGPSCIRGQVTSATFCWSLTTTRITPQSSPCVARVRSLNKGGVFSFDLLRAFCRAEGIRQTFTLPASPQQNGIAERRIGMVMDFARTSMIHAAAPHFLWPFAVQYAAHQINLQPRVSMPDTTPTLRWTGKVGDASAFRFYHPTSRRVLSSQAFTFDESVPYYHAIEPVEVAVDSGAARGVESTGAGSGGAEPERAEPGGAESGGAEPGVAESDGAEPEGAEPARVDRAAGAGGATGAGGSNAARAAGGCGVTSPGGARTGSTGAAGPGVATRARAAGGAGAGGIAGAGAAGGTRDGATGAAKASDGFAGAGGAAGAGAPEGAGVGATRAAGGAAGAGGVGPDTWGAGAVRAGSGGAARPRPYFVPLLEQVLGLPPSTGGLTEHREPESRHASPVRAARTCRRGSRQRPPPVPGTHQMDLRPSTAPQRVPLPSPPASSLPALTDLPSDLARTASPTVTRLLATIVTDPSFESSAASALVAELVDFAAQCRLDYAASLVAESESVCPPSVGGECALSTDVLEDRQEEFECFAAALPHHVSMLLAPEGDPDAPNIPTPRSYAEAIEGPYSSRWQTAMDAKMASWKSTGTYVDEVPPPGANIVSGMWIFRVKRSPGSPPDFKARYVARGFSQRQGVDYFQTFSPTLKMTTLRVPLHVVAQHDYELHSLDFSTSFLQGSLQEEMWLRRTPGFTGSFPAGTQWSLWRPVYSLRQAPREWHDTLRTTLVALGFAPSTADPSMLLRTDTTLPPFYILVYVDDLVFAFADTAGLAHVKSELQKRLTCTDLGELRNYLGLHITRDRAWRTITLTQSHMVQQVLQRFNFTYSSPQATPLSSRHSLSALPSDESVEPSGPYPELVGCLMYLMTCTRPDLAYSLSILARYVAPRRHRPEHMDAAKRVLRYLCSTSGMGLRSSQGYTFSLGSDSVSWRSTRSSSVLSSNCEAEIYGGAMAAQELRWLTYLLTDLGEAPRSPLVLYQRGQLRLAYVATRANTADIFTKALQPCDHYVFVLC